MDGDEGSDLTELVREFEKLEDSVESKKHKTHIQGLKEKAIQLSKPRIFGVVVEDFNRRDIVEAFLGSLLIGIPVIIEEGTLEIGEYIAQHPIFLIGTIIFGVLIVIGILYYTDIQEVKIKNPFFGVIPRRLVGIILIAFLSALLLMTVWGRVDWSEPMVALSQCAFTFVAMAIGAALADILPGT
ncbi:putative membrane protein [Methanonatronarchaeum thermophilum]|uniref:Putative membrane protein n=1 Tax=Methanonatronarchaeum thermophilum TaxID=1927129 RepID=A0A1Y3GD01_9EURY|nr:DUF2391 family protein [Methanonatronarchaeum thermophilum]OUJ19110.1 putative membrane protein [Methanonatronarchaeum thermophilum]